MNYFDHLSGMRIRIILFCTLAAFACFSQNINPGADKVFRPDEIATIRLVLAPEHKTYLLDPANAESEEYFPATFEMTNTQMDTLLAIEVGVRLRGNTSRYHQKKGFKIDFREYQGPRFYGYKKFNLKPDVNDPSLIRELLTLQLYREMEVPAARTHHVKLYMNEEYMGAYLNVEQIDDEFLNMRHGHEEGFLYKCEYGANLLDNGQVFNQVVFESELNEQSDTRAELDRFVEVLNGTSSTNFKSEIEKVFLVDRYLRQLAVEMLTGHWDGYSYNKNNFYLFYNGETKLFEFFPYDADNTWGIDWVGRDWAQRNLNTWYATGDPRPLTTRILGVPEYKQLFLFYCKELLENYFNESYLNPILDAYKTLLNDAIATDPYFEKAFGFTHTDFLNSFDLGMDNNHVDYGLREYLQVRTASAIQQVPALVTAVEEPLNTVRLYPNPSSEPRLFLSCSDTQQKSLQVYSSLGVAIPVQVAKTEERLEISFQEKITPGIYFIQYNGEILKWIHY